MRSFLLLALLCVSAGAVDPAQIMRDLNSPDAKVRRSAAIGARDLPTTPALVHELLLVAEKYPSDADAINGFAQESVYSALAQHGQNSPEVCTFFFKARRVVDELDSPDYATGTIDTIAMFFFQPTPAKQATLRSFAEGENLKDAFEALDILSTQKQVEPNCFPLFDRVAKRLLESPQSHDLSLRGNWPPFLNTVVVIATRGYQNEELLRFATKMVTDTKQYTAENEETLQALLATVSELGAGRPLTLATLKIAEGIAKRHDAHLRGLSKRVAMEIRRQQTGKLTKAPEAPDEATKVLDRVIGELKARNIPGLRELKIIRFNPDTMVATLRRLPESQRRSYLRKLMRALSKSDDPDLQQIAILVVENLYVVGPLEWRQVLADSRTCDGIIAFLREAKRID